MKMNVRPRFKEATFDNYRIENTSQKEIVGWLRNYAEKFDSRQHAGIILVGGMGTGKT